MPAFRFTAIDAQGQVQRGTMEAPDQAARQLPFALRITGLNLK